MEYVVQAFKALKILLHDEANTRAGFFVTFLTQTRFIITERPLGISLQISCSN